jgi:hypothetical protein
MIIHCNGGQGSVYFCIYTIGVRDDSSHISPVHVHFFFLTQEWGIITNVQPYLDYRLSLKIKIHTHTQSHNLIQSQRKKKNKKPKTLKTKTKLRGF